MRSKKIDSEMEKILAERVSYNKVTGEFTYKKIMRKGKEKVGDRFGFIGAGGRGYWVIRINNQQILAHRIAWFFTYGEWPQVVDHINGNTLDNRIENLRSVTQRVNNQNKKNHRNGKLVGASWSARDKSWSSLVKVNGKAKRIGSFRTEIEAHQAYMAFIDNLGTALDSIKEGL